MENEAENSKHNCIELTSSEPQTKFGRFKSKLAKAEFAKNVLTLMTGTGLAQIIAFLAQILIARLYTPVETGVLGILTAIVGTISTVAALRYEIAIVLPEDEDQARGLYRLSSRLNFGICAVSGLILWIFADPISRFSGSEAAKGYLPIAAGIAWATTQVGIASYWCNRRKKYKLMSANRIGQSVTTAGSQIGFGFLHFSVLGLALGTFLGQAFSVVNLHRNNRSDLETKSPVRAKFLMREYRKMPLLNGPNALVDAVRLNGIPILIGRGFGTAVLGHFTKAWQLLQAPAALINGAMSQVFYQQMATTKRGAMFGVVRRGILRSAIIGVFMFALVWLLSPWTFRVVLGPQWELGGYIGRELVPWLFANFITSPVSLLFVTVKRQELMLVFSLIYMAAPLAFLAFVHLPILLMIRFLSLIMAGLLVGFMLLSLYVARQFDNGHGLKDESATS